MMTPFRPLSHPDLLKQTRDQGGTRRLPAAQERTEKGAALGGPSTCCAAAGGARTVAATCRGHLEPRLARLPAFRLLALHRGPPVPSCVALLLCVRVLDDMGPGIHQVQLPPS